MSDADSEEISVSANGITVRKSLNTDQFRTPAVVFDVRSERSDAAMIRLRDDAPEVVEMENIGFHPDYGSDHWFVEEREVVFERTIAPGEEYTTIYGIRDIEDEAFESLLTDPSLEVVDEGAEGELDEIDDVVSEGNSQAVRDVISGERDTLPGLEEELESLEDEIDVDALEEDADVTVADAPDEAVEADDTGPEVAEAESAKEEAVAPEMPDTEAEPEAEDGDETEEEAEAELKAEPEAEVTPGDAPGDEEAPAMPAGGVARVLAKELRQGNVSEEDRKLLRDELAFTEGSTEARIQHLQNRMSDLAAYTDALEVFLDEEGRGRELLDDLDREIESLRGDIADLQENVDDLRSDVSGIETRTGETADAVSALEASVDDVEDAVSEVDDLADRIDEFEDDLDRIDDLEDELEAVRGDVREMTQFRDRLTSVFGPADGGEESEGGGEESNGE